MDNNKNQQEEYRMLLDQWKRMKKLIGDDLSVELVQCSCRPNVKGHDVSEPRRQALEDIMEALTESNIDVLGVCGKEDNHMESLMQRVIRSCWRDNLFGMIVMISIRENPDLKRIQHEIAHEIGCSFQDQEQQEKQDRRTGCCGFNYFKYHNANSNKVVTGNAQKLSDKIRTVPKILFILRDIRSRIDLGKLGIPFGTDHKGCKLILTSESENILSNQMNTQHTFKF